MAHDFAQRRQNRHCMGSHGLARTLAPGPRTFNDPGPHPKPTRSIRRLHPMFFGAKMKVPTKEEALPGRPDTMPVPARHFVLGAPLSGPFDSKYEVVELGLGCFWGAERKF